MKAKITYKNGKIQNFGYSELTFIAGAIIFHDTTDGSIFKRIDNSCNCEKIEIEINGVEQEIQIPKI